MLCKIHLILANLFKMGNVQCKENHPYLICRSRNPNCKAVNSHSRSAVCVITHLCYAHTMFIYNLYILHLSGLLCQMSLYGMAVGGGRAGNTRGNGVSLTHAHKRAHGCCNTALLWRKDHFLIFLPPAAEPQSLPNRNIHIFVMTAYEKKTPTVPLQL